MKSIVIKTINRSHSTILTETCLSELKDMVDIKQTICITDTNVFSLYKQQFPTERVIVIDSGESGKSMQNVEAITNKLLEYNADRNTLLVAIGGGVICDLAGFVASIFMRGIRFAFAPTTLLSQIDAAIGGKNGINYGSIKNLLGSVRQPEFVLCDISFISTLPKPEITSALAEAVKYALINNTNLLTFLEENTIPLQEVNRSILQKLITTCITIKSDIVEADEQEKGIRKHLNFGHTFGHAIEIETGIKHGEAISLGMIIAMKISLQRGYFSYQSLTRVANLLQALGLPVQLESSMQHLISQINFDKKKQGDSIDVILLKEIGEPVIDSIKIDSLSTMIRSIFQNELNATQ